jgi:thiol:disulfide interchange protein DsbC
MKQIKVRAPLLAGIALSLLTLTPGAFAAPQAEEPIEIPIKGGLYMHETADGTPILVSGDGRFVMPGRFVDRENDMNMITSLDEARQAFGESPSVVAPSERRSPGAQMLKDVNPSEMLSFTTGDQDGTKEEVIVWIDPFCPYCHRVMEMQSSLTDNYVFHNVVIPLLGPNSQRFVDVLACVERSEMGQAILNKNTSVQPTSRCRSTEQTAAQRYATSAGIQSVPMTVSASGRVQTGAFRSLEQFQSFLEAK